MDSRGGLRLHLEVMSRHLADEVGHPPHPVFREPMQSTGFVVELVPGAPGELHGRHRYTRGSVVFSAAAERYPALGLP